MSYFILQLTRREKSGKNPAEKRAKNAVFPLPNAVRRGILSRQYSEEETDLIRAILFDLDGTLADTLGDLVAAVNSALAAQGYPIRPAAAFPRYIGNGTDKMLERALPQPATAEQVAALRAPYLAYYSAHPVDHTTVFDGMPETLAALRARGVALGVVTNKAEQMAKTVLDRLYGENCFDVICAQGADHPAKPDPTTARLALADLGVSPEECLFVGDSDVDMQTARNSGTTAVGVTWGYRPADELRSAGAAVLIDRPQELLSLLDAQKDS